MKKLIGLVLILSACNGANEAQIESDPETGITPPETVVDPPPEVVAFQVEFVNAASDRRLASGESALMTFSLNVPFSAKTKCTWWKEIPDQPLVPGGTAPVMFGTVNGPCSHSTHNQNNSLDTNYWVVVRYNGDESYAIHKWSMEYDSGTVNNTVSVSADTPEGVHYLVDSKAFRVSRTDVDGDGLCSWEMDGVEVSSSCVQYTVEPSSSTRSLVYTIDDGVNAPDSVSWTIEPGAKITSVTPSSANLASGQEQVFSASVSDALNSGALCEWTLDGNVEQRGSCSYTYASDGLSHQINVELVYDGAGLERSGIVKTVYALPQVNNGVNIAGVTSTTTKHYFAKGVTSYVFGVTAFDDQDGDAHFEWTLNGNPLNCDVSEKCTFTNGTDSGLQLDNYSGERMVLTVKLTDGQYTDTHTWEALLDHSEIEESAAVGTKCNQAGTTFTIWGMGFESSDIFSLESRGIQLEVVSLNDTVVTLRLAQDVLTGSQAVRVMKGSDIDQTGSSFITFSSSSTYCN